MARGFCFSSCTVEPHMHCRLLSNGTFQGSMRPTAGQFKQREKGPPPIRCSYCYNILIHHGTHGTWGSKFTPPRDFLQTLVIVSLTFCLRQVSKYHMKTISPLFYSAVSVDLNPGNWLMEAFRPSSSEQAAHVVVQDLDSCSSGGATVSSDFYS